jgi:hypothetical protein
MIFHYLVSVKGRVIIVRRESAHRAQVTGLRLQGSLKQTNVGRVFLAPLRSAASENNAIVDFVGRAQRRMCERKGARVADPRSRVRK